MLEPDSEGSDAQENRSSSTPASEDEELPAQIIVFYPNKSPVAYKLHAGVNVIGRRSSIIERDTSRLMDWQNQFQGESVHAVFLESSSVSSTHAAIHFEPWQELCYIQDLGSRNKTFLRQAGKHKAIEAQKKCAMQSGGSLTFGALRCRISFGAGFEGLPILSNSPNAIRSSAVAIGQSASNSADAVATSLDHCPSLQEWFRYPSGGRRQSPPHDVSTRLNTDSAAAYPLVARNSFGFIPRFQDEDHTSSDAEPVTPRIDRPVQSFGRAKPDVVVQNPFATALETMVEDEKEGDESDELQDHAMAEEDTGEIADVQAAKADDLPHLRSGPTARAASPAVSLTEDERDQGAQEHYQSRAMSPLKRTRSDRVNTEIRSKSPRLQRGFLVKEPSFGLETEPSFRLEEMRDAVSKINT